MIRAVVRPRTAERAERHGRHRDLADARTDGDQLLEEVARIGYDCPSRSCRPFVFIIFARRTKALMAGKECVVAASLSTKLQGRGSRLLPDGLKARIPRRLAEPGSAKK
jgi:hypothetical protein